MVVDEGDCSVLGVGDVGGDVFGWGLWLAGCFGVKWGEGGAGFGGIVGVGWCAGVMFSLCRCVPRHVRLGGEGYGVGVNILLGPVGEGGEKEEEKKWGRRRKE